MPLPTKDFRKHNFSFADELVVALSDARLSAFDMVKLSVSLDRLCRSIEFSSISMADLLSELTDIQSGLLLFPAVGDTNANEILPK